MRRRLFVPCAYMYITHCVSSGKHKTITQCIQGATHNFMDGTLTLSASSSSRTSLTFIHSEFDFETLVNVSNDSRLWIRDIYIKSVTI